MLNTARGSGTGLSTVGPAKVKACSCRSLLFTKDVSDIEIKTYFLSNRIIYLAKDLISFQKGR